MSSKKKYIFNLLMFAIVLFISTAIAEIGIRVLDKKHYINVLKDERNLSYRFDKNLGWLPLANSNIEFRRNRNIHIKNNSLGFRDDEFIQNNKPSIMFLGDSFLWGFDVEKNERFTENLKKKLPRWNILNLGISGYGTDQEYLLLKQYYEQFKPTIIFLIFCADNDRRDNSTNIRYKGYYKPYFTIKNKDNLMLQGVPVEKSENFFLTKYEIPYQSYLFRFIARVYFNYMNKTKPIQVPDPTHTIIKNMYNFSKEKNAKFYIGIQGQDSLLENFLDRNKIQYINLINPYKYTSYGKHWTPKGHNVVSNLIYNFLSEQKKELDNEQRHH